MGIYIENFALVWIYPEKENVWARFEKEIPFFFCKYQKNPSCLKENTLI